MFEPLISILWFVGGFICGSIIKVEIGYIRDGKKK